MPSWRDDRSRSAGRRRRRRCAASGGSAARWPTGPYICSRRSTSLTGLPTSRAAMMPSSCGPEIRPLEPKPPPRKGLRMWMFSGGMPNNPAIRPCAMARPWLGVSIDSAVAVPRRHDRVRLHRRCGTGSASRRSHRCALPPLQDPPRHRHAASSDGLPTPTAGGTKLSPASRPTRAGCTSYRGDSSAAPSVAASSVSAITTAIGWFA